MSNNRTIERNIPPDPYVPSAMRDRWARVSWVSKHSGMPPSTLLRNLQKGHIVGMKLPKNESAGVWYVDRISFREFQPRKPGNPNLIKYGTVKPPKHFR